MNKIIIVGGGIAGLAAAHHLTQNNFDVQILEGRNRCGGRVFTQSFLGLPLDMGASWIHGIKHNPITTLAKQLDIKLLRTDGKRRKIYDRKQQGIPFLKNSFYSKRLGRILKRAENNLISPDQPLLTLLNQLSPSSGTNEWSDFFDAQMEMLGLYNGAEVESMSARYWDQEKPLKGGNYFLLDTYSPIVKYLAEQQKIIYNTAVRRILQKSDYVEVITDSISMQADAVIVTASLGVLQNNLIHFEPELSASKKIALQRLKMGVLNKIALRFPKIFWPKNYFVFATAKTYPGPQAYLNYYQLYKAPILVGFIGGEKAKALEHASNESIIAQTMQNLRTIFGNAIPEPDMHYITRWNQDPFSCGSYSYIPVGAKDKDHDTLAEPLTERILFAGEATYREHPACVHGAYLSGLREAERLIHYLK